MKNWLGVGLSALLLLSGCGVLPEEEEVLSPPIKEAADIEYKTQEVARGDISSIVSGTAYVASGTSYELSFMHRGGYIKEISVREGQSVKKGDVLASLDTDSLEMDIQIKELQIERLITELEQSRENGSSGDSVWALEDQLSKQENELSELKLQAEEQTDTEEAEELDSQITYLELAIEATKLAIEEAYNSGSYARNYTAEYKSVDLAIAQLELEDLKLQLEKSTITAPVDGTVTFVEKVAVGEYVAAQTPIVRLADLSDLVIQYEGKGADEIKLGMEAKVVYSKKTYTGTVVMTPKDVPSDQADLYRDTVHISLPEMPSAANIGDKCTFEIVTQEKTDVLVVPKNAVTQFVGVYYARVMTEDGIRKDQEIEIGIQSDTHYEVVSGLEEGDTLILE